MRLNTAAAMPKNYTHEGAVAKRITPYQELRRSVLSCLLWERGFYESGEDIAARISRLAGEVDRAEVIELAREARTDFHLRHVPLLLVDALVRKGGSGVADVVEEVIQRPDEMAELLAIYWRDGRKPIPKQLKLGLARAFGKFNEYSLAKYDRDGPVKLRDVLFLCHAKPDGPEREALYRRVANRELVVPDTWEVGLSSGGDKRAVFERLLREGKLGYMALLRNLRGMVEAGVDEGLMREAILARKGAGRVLPFRYVAAARACPQMEPYIDQALCEAVACAPRLPGRTLVLVDVSGSMGFSQISGKSDMTYMDAACTLASVINADRRVFSFSARVVEVPARVGMSGVDAIRGSQSHLGTYLGAAVSEMNQIPHDRLVVITDEQSHDRVPDPVAKHAYMINVATNQSGVGYGRWTHIDGFSESVLRFIQEVERERG